MRRFPSLVFRADVAPFDWNNSGRNFTANLLVMTAPTRFTASVRSRRYHPALVEAVA
jgi:hypothetical protein